MISHAAASDRADVLVVMLHSVRDGWTAPGLHAIRKLA